jgi:FKBP-type peptidyl-prolyl cis-trans isomerase FklB
MSLFDKLQGNRKAKIEEEKQAGAKFLAENKQDNDVIELPSGIQYKVITAGSGPKPDINNTIKAHYQANCSTVLSLTVPTKETSRSVHQ